MAGEDQFRNQSFESKKSLYLRGFAEAEESGTRGSTSRITGVTQEYSQETGEVSINRLVAQGNQVQW